MFRFSPAIYSEVPRPKKLEDAIAFLKRCEELFLEAHTTVLEARKDQVRIRFYQGRTISDLLAGAHEDQISAILRELQAELGRSRTDLYRMKAFYEHPLWKSRPLHLEKWLEKEPRPNWAHVRGILSQADKEEDVRLLTRAEQLEQRAMRLEEDADALVAEVTQSGSHQAEEIIGVAVRAKEEAQANREHAQKLREKMKDKTPRNSRYLDFIRRQPCVITDRPTGIHAHHLLTGGGGMKGSDYACIPLHHTIHGQIHDWPLEQFADHYGFNPWEACTKLLIKYFTGTIL